MSIGINNLLDDVRSFSAEKYFDLFVALVIEIRHMQAIILNQHFIFKLNNHVTFSKLEAKL